MKAEAILRSHVLDIIFEGRNKMYGAYALRMQYDKRLLSALAVCLGFSTVIFLLLQNVSVKSKTDSVSPVLISVKESSIMNTEKHTATSGRSARKKAAVTLARVNVVKDADVKQKDVKFTLTDAGTDPGEIENLTSGSGEQTDGGSLGKTTDSNKVTLIKNYSIDNSIHLSVDAEASFPGGLNSWASYLRKNLKPDAAIQQSVTAGIYRVVVKFIVSKDGSISNVNAITDHGFGFEDEAERVIRNGPKWLPAYLGGVAVNSYKEQVVIFTIQEE